MMPSTPESESSLDVGAVVRLCSLGWRFSPLVRGRKTVYEPTFFCNPQADPPKPRLTGMSAFADHASIAACLLPHSTSHLVSAPAR